MVSAGAGTGKTTLLVERVLATIGSGEAPLSAMAAITFTDKAAGELRQKIAAGLTALGDLAEGRDVEPSGAAARAFTWLESAGVSPPQIAERVKRAERGLDRAVITTIHGFCSQILRQYPLETGLAPGFTIDRGLRGRREALEEWTAFLDDEMGPDGRRAVLWARLLRHFDLDTLGEIGRALGGGAIPEDALTGTPRPFDLHAAWREPARQLSSEIDDTMARVAGLTDAPREWLTEAARALAAFADDGPAAARAAIESAKRLSRDMSSVRTKKVSDTDAATLEALEGRAWPFLEGLLDHAPDVESDLFDALIPFVRRLRSRCIRAGLVDFDGLLVRTRDLLRDDPRVRAIVKRRFRSILVDEFQDTDPIQYEIIFFLAEPLEDAAADPFATHLVPGRLFIVGDAKQSIYRFRGADFAAYQRSVRHVVEQGGRQLALSSNFRSLPSVVRPINAVFSSPAVWTTSDFLPPYEPIDAERAAVDGSGVEVWTPAIAPKTLADERRRVEGQIIASEIAALVGNGTCGYKDVLVLFRGFSSIVPYLRALLDASIPFVVSGGRDFVLRTEIVQAMAVLRAVADPEDEVARLAYRRSPAGGVPDTELFSEATGASGERPALAAADARLVELREKAADLPVDAAIRYVLEASGMLALSALAFQGAQRLANLEKLLRGASEIARDGRRSLVETLDALEEGFEAEDEGDSPLADEDHDAIRVMTIHKAKGLEAKVVILADTAAERRGRQHRKIKVGTVPTGDGDHIVLETGSFRSSAAIALSLDEAPHEAAEETRLLYVALTRARDRLIVLGGGRQNTPWSKAIAGWTDGVTRRAIAPAASATGRSPAPSTPSEAGAAFESAARAAVQRATPALRSPSLADEYDAPHVAGALDPALARQVGRIVHARLAGVDMEARGRAAAEAASILDSRAAAALRERLRTLDVVGREVPLLFGESEAAWRGTIDLLYRDADGTLVVADFKTDAEDDGAADRHRAQLSIYARALSRAFPDIRVRAELWMLRSGRIVRGQSPFSY